MELLDIDIADKSIFQNETLPLSIANQRNLIQLNDCNNLTISNLSLDYDPLWFTQGTITAVNGNNLTLRIDAGYRDDFENFLIDQYSVMRLHDPETGGHLAGATTDYEINSVKRSSSGVLIATMSIPYTNAGEYRPQVGNRFSLYQCHSGAVIMTNCKNTTYNSFNIYVNLDREVKTNNDLGGHAKGYGDQNGAESNIFTRSQGIGFKIDLVNGKLTVYRLIAHKGELSIICEAIINEKWHLMEKEERYDFLNRHFPDSDFIWYTFSIASDLTGYPLCLHNLWYCIYFKKKQKFSK